MTDIEIYRDQLLTLRISICDDIINIFKKHQKTETVSLCETCVDSILIRDASDDDNIFTLDRIGINKNNEVYVDASSSWDNDTFTAEELGPEILCNVLELLENNQEELFEDEDESEE